MNNIMIYTTIDTGEFRIPSSSCPLFNFLQIRRFLPPFVEF